MNDGIDNKKIDRTAYIADGVRITGNVMIGADSSVWYNTVIRSTDDMPVIIGERTNIQDNCTIHASNGRTVRIGDGVTVGHMALIHCCEIGDNSLIGMGSIIMNNAKIGKNCIIGAGSLVTQNTVIPDGSLAFGRPAKVIRMLTEEQIAGNVSSADQYVEESREMMQTNPHVKQC